MKNIFFTLLAAVVLASCGNDGLSFHAFAINDRAGQVNIAVAEDGTINAWGKKVGTLGHDGTVTDATGRQTATLEANGTLTGLTGNTLVEIDADGALIIKDSPKMYWNDTGEFVKGDQKLNVKIKPADEASYRAASVVFFLHSGLFTY